MTKGRLTPMRDGLKTKGRWRGSHLLSRTEEIRTKGIKERIQ